MLRTRGGAAADGWQTSPAQARAARDRAASSYGSPLRVTLLMHAKSLLVHILDAPDTRKIFLFFSINCLLVGGAAVVSCVVFHSLLGLQQGAPEGFSLGLCVVKFCSRCFHHRSGKLGANLC